MNSPQVSVIVPNYNHARFLGQRLDSILAQNFTDYEIILLDDASTDNSREIIERYRGNEKISHIVFSETNSGRPISQWKKGLSLAKGSLVWIAESDDFCDPDFLECAVQSFSNSAIDLFYCKSVVVDEHGKQLSDMSSWYKDVTSDLDNDYEMSGDDELSEHLFYKNTIANASSVVFKRQHFVEQVLTRYENMRYCGDWLFWMEYCDWSVGVCYSVQTKNYFRSHVAVTRKEGKHDARNKELIEVLRFILNHLGSKGRKREIFRYFQQHHFFIQSRGAIKANFALAMKQAGVSLVALSWWCRYYFTGTKP